MTAIRRAGALVAATGLAALTGVLPARPAAAHGATTQPVSRTAACARGSADAGSPACLAARAANGRPFGTFDNLRVPGVAGRDRQYVPDGNLCSGGLPEFAGLDLARDDWPATRLDAGATIAVRYATTVPHRGTFRVYLTRPGYDPGGPLRWDDLGAEPIFSATDPPVRGGAYRFGGRLPADRTGRHVLYVVWQTSSTPDTYYSCSDVILRAPAAGAAAAPPRTTAKRGAPPAGRSAEPGAVAAPADPGGSPPGAGAPPARESWLSRSTADDRTAPGRQFFSVALIVAAGVTAGLAIMRIRRAPAVRRTHR
jgi:chitin-binding protein